MVILTKKTKYDSILEGVKNVVNETVMGDLRKIGNSKTFTPLKRVLGGKFYNVETGFRVHKIKDGTYTLDVEYYVENHDLDVRLNIIVRCDGTYTSEDKTKGTTTITAKQIIVQELDAPVTTLNTFKPFKVKCDITAVEDLQFISTEFKFVAEKVIITLFDELLKNKELDAKLAKSTGDAKGFSTVKEFMLVSYR